MTTPTDVTFVDEVTVVEPGWINGVNDWTYGWFGVMGEVFTPAAARTAFAVPSTSDIQAQTATAFTTAGTSTAFTLDVTPNITAYAAGHRFRVKFNATAGAAPTLNIDSVGAVALKLYDSSGAKVAASATSIISGMLTDVEYDGTDMVIIDQLPGNFASKGANSDITSLSGLTTPLSAAQGGTGGTGGFNTIGSYCLCYYDGAAALSAGSSVSGGNLSPSNAIAQTVGSVLTGTTWLCLGACHGTGASQSSWNVTLFKRTA